MRPASRPHPEVLPKAASKDQWPDAKAGVAVRSGGRRSGKANGLAFPATNVRSHSGGQSCALASKGLRQDKSTFSLGNARDPSSATGASSPPGRGRGGSQSEPVRG